VSHFFQDLAALLLYTVLKMLREEVLGAWCLGRMVLNIESTSGIRIPRMRILISENLKMLWKCWKKRPKDATSEELSYRCVWTIHW
jgi:hypothetical protein